MITRSIKMALKKIYEACEERESCRGCPFTNATYGCFFTMKDEGRIPEEWHLDLLKEEEE